jgi:hypothetical protein
VKATSAAWWLSLRPNKVKLSEKLLGLLILLIPTQLGKHFWPDFSLIYGLRIDYLSPTLYLTDVLIVLILFLWVVEEKPKIKLSFWAMLGGFALLLGIISSTNFEVGVYKLVKLFELVGLGYYVCRVKSSWTIILRFLPWALVYTSLIAIVQFCQQSSLNNWFWLLGERPLSVIVPGIALENLGGSLFLRPYATFSHPNSMAGLLLVGLISTLFTFKKIRFFWGYLGLILWGIFLSFSYSAWLVGVAILGLYFLFGKKKKSLFATGFLTTGLVVLGFTQISSQSVIERWQLMLAAFSMIKDNFFFGVGLNNFIVRLPEYWVPISYRLWQPVHNFYLLTFAETGIVVFVLVIIFFAKTARKLLAGKNYSLFLALVAILLLGFFDHYWLTLQQNQILLSLILGLSWQKNLPKGLQ